LTQTENCATDESAKSQEFNLGRTKTASSATFHLPTSNIRITKSNYRSKIWIFVLFCD